ncbi:Kinesin-like protein KIF26B [Fukomys damarensis]|uniref:Kinesin-like protein KIF26B n=1 Tax=Fukomys damarensis TaxID=885580 RepID=A0A091D362_FUKDA|nr:Kinesin-like protein KIF26B [Fukomys damarensis]
MIEILLPVWLLLSYGCKVISLWIDPEPGLINLTPELHGPVFSYRLSFLCLCLLQDPAFSAVIHERLQVPNTIRKAWNDRDNRCDICATHLNQLKQEAIQMVLTLEQAAGSEHYDASPGSPPPLSNMPTLGGSRHVSGGLQQPRDWAFVPAAYATSNYTGLVNKHSSKPSSLGVSNGAEKKSGSPPHQPKVSLQMATSPSNGNVPNAVAIQAHQYLDGTWSLSRTNGVTLYPYQVSTSMSEEKQGWLDSQKRSRQPFLSPLFSRELPSPDPGAPWDPHSSVTRVMCPEQPALRLHLPNLLLLPALCSSSIFFLRDPVGPGNAKCVTATRSTARSGI